MDGERFALKVPDVGSDVMEQLIEMSGDRKVRLSRIQCHDTLDYLTALRAKIKDVNGFWPYTLMSHPVFTKFCTSSSDQHALSFLTDIELKQDPKDPRPFELVFHFRENQYFSNPTISRKWELPQDAPSAPEDGSITQEMRAFDEDDLVSPPTKIDWKSSEKDLVAKYPRQKVQPKENGEVEDGDEFEGDIGSFFCFFTEEGDAFSLGAIMKDDLLANAIDYFSGQLGEPDDEEDSEDELDEEGGTDEEEIDLEEEEEPARKKRKA